ncbi:MAG: ATP-binding protein [Thermodesulfobacteriota bacterium]|nr:MAG: ATP-binding protein [Thermodesulfobacteriota bacterium]
MFKSIKIKIIIWCLIIFSVVFAGLELLLYYELERVAIGFIDDHMESEVELLASILKVEESHGKLEHELQELSVSAKGEYAVKLSGHYYQIVSPRGKILSRSPSLGLANARLPMLVPTEGQFNYATITGPKGEPLRIASKAIHFDEERLIFVAGDTLEGTYKLLNSFRRIVLIIYPIAFILSAAGILFITGWALVPLKFFSAKISQITEENLYERIEEGKTPMELKPLAASFNTMLGRLEKSFERRKHFLSDASHELRTPTAVIKSYCDVVLGRERSAEDYRKALEKIATTVNRMRDIINRILVVSRLDGRTLEFNYVRVDIKETLSDVLRLVEPSALCNKVTVNLQGPSITIHGDLEGITEVFSNLVENAIKYNRPGGRVDITIGKADGFAVVTVADTGMGVSEKDRKRIFERFFRADLSRGVTVGTGLGLSIVKAIVEAHGGRIELESELGSGSTFRVFLPIERAVDKSTAEA